MSIQIMSILKFTQERLDKKYSKKILVKAQRILQYAHDYIEINGFDITVSSDFGLSDDAAKLVKKGELKGVDVGNVCFIGGTRLGAGTNPQEYWRATDYGDGPELTAALEIIDRIVIDRCTKSKEIDRLNSWNGRGNEPGEFAEAYGCMNGMSSGNKDAGNNALSVYRDALRWCYNEIEKKTRK